MAKSPESIQEWMEEETAMGYGQIPEYDPETEECKKCHSLVGHLGSVHKITKKRLTIPGPAYIENGKAYGICSCTGLPKNVAESEVR